MDSLTYTLNSSFTGLANVRVASGGHKYLGIVNPEYLKIIIQKTRFRREEGALEFVQGLLLQGWFTAVAKMVD